MSHFAKVVNGIVTQVVVAEPEYINTIDDGSSGQWIQTSYNTHGNSHPQGMPLRKNYASIGYSYDAQRDAFVPPKPYPSWVLDENTCLWQAPVPMPQDNSAYIWNEQSRGWDLLT